MGFWKGFIIGGLILGIIGYIITLMMVNGTLPAYLEKPISIFTAPMNLLFPGAYQGYQYLPAFVIYSAIVGGLIGGILFWGKR